MRSRQIWIMGLALLVLCFVSAETGIGFFGKAKIKNGLSYNDYGGETFQADLTSSSGDNDNGPRRPSFGIPVQPDHASTSPYNLSSLENVPPSSPRIPPQDQYGVAEMQSQAAEAETKRSQKQVGGTPSSDSEDPTVVGALATSAPSDGNSKKDDYDGPALGIGKTTAASNSSASPSNSVTASSVSKTSLVQAAELAPQAAIESIEAMCQWTTLGFTGLISLDGVESTAQGAPRYDSIPVLSSGQASIASSEIGTMMGITGGRNFIDSLQIQTINKISGGRSCLSVRTLGTISGLSGSSETLIMGLTTSIKGVLDTITNVSGGVTMIKGMKINRIFGGTGGVLILEGSEVGEISDYNGTIFVKDTTFGSIVRSQQPILLP